MWAAPQELKQMHAKALATKYYRVIFDISIPTQLSTLKEEKRRMRVPTGK
jgi:hypothetical protein